MLLVDMNMPYACWHCKLIKETSNGTVCGLTEKQLDRVKCRTEKLDNCPLIEIPESRPSTLDKLEPFLNWCEETGHEFNSENYQEYLDRQDIDNEFIRANN